MFGRSKKKYKLGVALGGGGTRGYAHLGVLQALKEKGLEPEIISGVSAGAIAGAYIASGKSPEEAFKLIKKYGFTDFTKFQIPNEGLLGLDKMRKAIEKEIAVNRIEDLKIPLIITVSDVLKGQVQYLTEGPLAQTVQASASIPVLFSPVHMNGSVYCDGGLFDNLPVKPLKGQCKKIIGVSVSPVQELDEISGLIQMASRVFQLGVNLRRKEIAELCDAFIEPLDLCQFDTLDTKHADEVFEIGYNHARDMDLSALG